jgi:hypothetical protein
LLKQKVAPKVAIILSYFILSKNHNEPPKVAHIGEKLPNLVTLVQFATDLFYSQRKSISRIN